MDDIKVDNDFSNESSRTDTENLYKQPNPVCMRCHARRI